MLIHQLSKINSHLPFYHEGKLEISEYASLYLTNTIRVIAVSMAGIFIPIYIFNISNEYILFHPNIIINGFMWILSYFLVRSATVMLSLIVFGKILFSKLHFQFSIILSFFFLIVMILLWHLSKNNLHFIWVAGIFAGLEIMFYWVPYHIFFMRKSDGKDQNFGKKTSFRFFLTRLSSSLAPALGGLIIVNYGFSVLFLISVILLIIAALPITFAVHEWKHHDHNPVRVIKEYFFEKKRYKLILAYAGEGMENIVYSLFWPLLLFFVLQSFVKLGFINSISFLVSSFTVLYMGRMIDKHGTKKIHAIGTVLNSLFYIPRIFLNNAIIFYGLDVMDRFTSSAYSLPIMSLSYEKGKKLGESDFILFREFALHTGMIIMILLIFLIMYATGTWRWVFIFGTLGTLLTYFIEWDKS